MLTVNIEKSESLNNGININQLKPGTMVFVVTKNSLYKIKRKIGDGEIEIQGGKKFRESIDAILVGSTFGGTPIKLRWIGYQMFMEVFVSGKIYRTTQVLAARIIGDGWEWDMEWK